MQKVVEKQNAPEFSKLELQIQELLGKEKIEKDRVYKVNKKDLVVQIDELVKREFGKVLRGMAYKK